MYNQEEVEHQLAAIQKGTRTSMPWFLPIHERMRMKYGWYYRWHMHTFASTLHWVILVAYLMGVTTSLSLLYVVGK